MKLLKIGLIFFMIVILAACARSTQPAATAISTATVQAGENKNCIISDTLFTVDASDLKSMLERAGLTITSFSISGTGQASTCTTAYSHAIHFMQITLNAPDEKKATLGKQLNTLVYVVNDWLVLSPAWVQSHLDKYNIYMTVTINPGKHQLSKTPAEILAVSNQGFTDEVFWDALNK